MKDYLKVFAVGAVLLLTAALGWAYPRTVLLEVFTNYG